MRQAGLGICAALVLSAAVGASGIARAEAARIVRVDATDKTAVEAADPAIQAVIGAQIDAMRADDFTRAFTYASPTIQGIFKTPQTFGDMVKQGYPMVWHPATVKFLQLRRVAGNLWQRVMVGDGAGHIHMLDYEMVRIDGAWKIGAVQLLPGQNVGV